MHPVYEFIRFWLPLVTAAGLVIKAYFTIKKSVSVAAHSLLSNHMTHIQEAAIETVKETKRTNELLEAHTEKEMQVWHGVVTTLSVLEDRTRTPRLRAGLKRK